MGQVFRNCIIRAQRSHLKKTNVFRKASSLFFFWLFSVTVLGSGQWKHRHVCQKWILSLHRNFFWGKENQTFSGLFSLDFRRNLFEILANYLGHPCRSCLVSVQMNHLGKKVLDNFFSSVMMSRKLWNFVKKSIGRFVIGMFVKTEFYLWQEHFTDKSFNDVLFFFGNLAEKFSNF